MAYPRSTTRFLAAAATLVATATPALADDPGGDALRLTAPASPAAVAKAQRHAAIERKRERAARERRRNPGPFVPVVGKADYGTAENAFGAARSGHMHAGHDIFASPGTPLVAVADAVVLETGSDGGQGNYVHLYDSKRRQTYVYMHMIGPARVRRGERVAAGELLGGVGCTGSCWGDHLHFEIRAGKGFGAEATDPRPQLERWDKLSKPL